MAKGTCFSEKNKELEQIQLNLYQQHDELLADGKSLSQEWKKRIRMESQTNSEWKSI
jgi:hypothetical protein